jgi:hypothetical protein
LTLGRLVESIKKRPAEAMDSAKNLRFVEGEEDSAGLSSDLGSTSASCEDELEMIAAQKNRERFAIKKTYSVEVNIAYGICICKHCVQCG